MIFDRATEGDKTLAALLHFRLGERNAEFFGDRVRDGSTAHEQVAGEKAAFLGKNQIRGARTEIDDDDGLVGIRIIVAEGVVERRRGKIDAQSLGAAIHDLFVDLVQRIRLHRDDDDLGFDGTRLADEFIVPRHLVDRERNVLLGLKLDNLADAVRANRRQLHKTGKHRVAGDAIPDALALEFELGDEFLHRDAELGHAAGVHAGIAVHVHEGVPFENEVTTAGFREKRPADALGAEVDDCDAFGVCHALGKERLAMKKRVREARGGSYLDFACTS